MNAIIVKRVYLPSSPEDGARVLADRLWPRGITKERAALTFWARDAAPSAQIRREFAHQPERFTQFAEDYTAELEANPAAELLAEKCSEWLQNSNVTLLYAARDGECSNAAVLRRWLKGRLQIMNTTEETDNG